MKSKSPISCCDSQYPRYLLRLEKKVVERKEQKEQKQ